MREGMVIDGPLVGDDSRWLQGVRAGEEFTAVVLARANGIAMVGMSPMVAVDQAEIIRLASIVAERMGPGPESPPAAPSRASMLPRHHPQP